METVARDVYRWAERALSEGERIQFTAPNRDKHVANRELGTIEKIDESGNLRIRLDYGYAVTSHSQGQTSDRVLIHVDPEHGGEKFVNRRLAYVTVSRSRCDT